MADVIDWGVHRGSCRVFYAERRCTCGATVASNPMARPAEPTGDSRACQQSDWCGPGSHCLCVPAEPTGELLRQQTALLLKNWINSPDQRYRAADALLSGPLAPLLAKLRAVEEITADLERTFRGSNIPVRLRRALDAS